MLGIGWDRLHKPVVMAYGSNYRGPSSTFLMDLKDWETFVTTTNSLNYIFDHLLTWTGAK